MPILLDNNRYAIAGAGCDGGSIHIFANISGSWQDIAGTQNLFSCSTIRRHNVPLALLAAENVVENAGHGDGKPVTCSQPGGSATTLAS